MGVQILWLRFEKILEGYLCDRIMDIMFKDPLRPSPLHLARILTRPVPQYLKTQLSKILFIKCVLYLSLYQSTSLSVSESVRMFLNSSETANPRELKF